VIARLELGRSAGYDRIKRALASGYLVNLAARGERMMKLAIGAPLPGDADFLPTPGRIVRAMSDTRGGQAKPGAIGGLGSVSGIPAPPARKHEREKTSVTQAPLSGINEEPPRGGRWWLARDGRRRSVDLEPPAFSGEVVGVEPAQGGA
jgi:hypothetical protein